MPLADLDPFFLFCVTLLPLNAALGIFIVYPLWRICQRAGMSGAWSVVAAFPHFGPLLLGLMLSVRMPKAAHKRG